LQQLWRMRQHPISWGIIVPPQIESFLLLCYLRDRRDRPIRRIQRHESAKVTTYYQNEVDKVQGHCLMAGVDGVIASFAKDNHRFQTLQEIINRNTPLILFDRPLWTWGFASRLGWLFGVFRFSYRAFWFHKATLESHTQPATLRISIYKRIDVRGLIRSLSSTWNNRRMRIIFESNLQLKMVEPSDAWNSGKRAWKYKMVLVSASANGLSMEAMQCYDRA